MLTHLIKAMTAGIVRIAPDAVYYPYRYWKIHRRLGRLSRPKRFSEKVFHRMRHPAPVFSTLADKLAVRQHIAHTVGERYLVPLLHACERVTPQTFAHLPRAFVMKANHSAGQVRIVRDQREEDLPALAALANGWLRTDFSRVLRERHYRAIPPRIVFEEALLDDGQPPADYKVNVFHAAPGASPYVFIQVMQDRLGGLKQDIFLEDWTLAPYQRSAHASGGLAGSSRPPQLDDMLTVAKRLAAPFGYLRVDFYIHRERLYIGELTFTPGAGTYTFTQPEWDEILGEKFGWPEPFGEAAGLAAQAAAPWPVGAAGARRRA